MHDDETFLQARRGFLTSTASGAGAMALSSLLLGDGVLAADADQTNPLAPKKPHFSPRATRCIFIYAAGGPSQIDLFDPKPEPKADIQLTTHHAIIRLTSIRTNLSNCGGFF